MGPVKAALESAVRYLAAELGPKGIRVHAISPGPLATRAASGIPDFDALMERVAERAPARRLVTIEEVGAACVVPVQLLRRGDDRRHDLYRRRLSHPRLKDAHSMKMRNRAADRRHQRRFVVAEIQLLRGRKAALDRPSRRDRRASESERQRARRRVDRTARARRTAGDGAKRIAAGNHPMGARTARRPAAGGARPPRRPWRDALLAAGAGHTRIVGRARGPGAAGAVARAAQSGADQNGAAAQSRPAAGGVLRYRVSPHRTRSRAGLCPALFAFTRRVSDATAFTGCPTNTSPRSCRERAPEIADGRVVVAHLGNGCSACALEDGVSVATTMGFTALDGLPMGTRCGELDRRRRAAPDPAEEHGRRRRLSICSIAARACSDYPGFRRIFANCWPATSRARGLRSRCSAIGSPVTSRRLAAALGGLDGVVFTAGVGENAAPVRAAICRACAWLGLELDEAANHDHRERISTPGSRVAAFVIKTDENLMIARHARALAATLTI